MGMKTTYTCDRCGKTQDNDNQMWSVGLVYRHGNSGVRYETNPNVYKEALWCRPCMVHLGPLAETDPVPKGVPQIPPPTLEDLVR